ncbi:MAG: hypothetical protein ACR2GY_13840 [Phycisphaerales bacterium]
MAKPTTVFLCIAAGFLAAGAVMYLAVWRRPPNPVDVAFQQSRPLVKQLAMRPLTSRDDVTTSLEKMEVIDVTRRAISPSTLDALKDTLANAISLYMIQEEPDGYIQWRRANGYEFESREEVDTLTPWKVDDTFMFLSTRTDEIAMNVTAESSVEALYCEFWRARRLVDGGRNVATAIAADASGVRSEIRMVVNDSVWSDFGDEGEGRLKWFGGNALANRKWFAHPIEEQLLGQDVLIAAETGVFFEFADGVRRPLIFLSLFDEASGRWFIRRVGMTNRPSTYMSWPWEL